MTNYAITGGNGLIGQKLKERIDKKGDKCNLEIDTRKGSNILNINDMHYNSQTQPIDIFYHLAASCSINKCIENPRLSHYNNAEGTFQVLEFCRKNNIPKIVYTSSSRILSPEENPYTASKKYAEHLVEAYKQCYGLEFLIVRPSTVYGGKFDITTRLISKWIQNALEEKSLELYGDKNKTLDFTHVDDFVDGIELLLNNWNESKNQIYDISGNDNRKLTEVYDLIIKKTNSKSSLIFKNAEKAQPQIVSINTDKIRKFGFTPRIKLEEGINETLDWYKKNKEIWSKNDK